MKMKPKPFSCTRRELLGMMFTGVAAAGLYFPVKRWATPFFETESPVFIASASNYSIDIASILLKAFKELGMTPDEIRNKSVLLKPNLVEPHKKHIHINTNPLVIYGAIEAFLTLGASRVVVAESPGHRRDTLYCVEESGLGEILDENKTPFIDLNTSRIIKCVNQGNRSDLGPLFLPEAVVEADFVVSIAKMKTHHWAGATLSMKNMFGVMPGNIYGWPKNRLHWAGITQSIIDINATVKPDFAIIDGIIGMQGDGPIMGTPANAGVLVLGRNPAAVDATASRLMDIDPLRLSYLAESSGWLGTIHERNIPQRGELIRNFATRFQLFPDTIPAHRRIRLR